MFEKRGHSQNLTHFQPNHEITTKNNENRTNQQISTSFYINIMN